MMLLFCSSFVECHNKLVNYFCLLMYLFKGRAVPLCITSFRNSRRIRIQDRCGVIYEKSGNREVLNSDIKFKNCLNIFCFLQFVIL